MNYRDEIFIHVIDIGRCVDTCFMKSKRFFF